MANFKELILSDEFKAYRKRQVGIVVEFMHREVRAGLSGQMDTARISGALDMANRFIKLPGELTTDKNIAEKLERMIQEDVAAIAANLVRNYLEG